MLRIWMGIFLSLVIACDDGGGDDVLVDMNVDVLVDMNVDVNVDRGGMDALPEIPFTGTYLDESGAEHIVGASSWTITYVGTQPSVFDYHEVSLDQQFIVAQNQAGNEYFPGLWSRFDWYFDAEEMLWFCQIAYDSASADVARAVGGADRNDMQMGCNGFAWSKLVGR